MIHSATFRFTKRLVAEATGTLAGMTAAGAGGARDGSARERTTEALVAAAMRLFGERGPGAVSLREVAAEAGVNYGLIHQYVGTKDDLLALVIKDYENKLRTMEREGAALPARLTATVAELADAYGGG